MALSSRDAALAEELENLFDRLLRKNKARRKPRRRAPTSRRVRRMVVEEVAIVRLNRRQLLDRIKRRSRRLVAIVIV